MTEKKPPAPKGPKSASEGRDPATGRLLPGHSMPGPGRPPLPDILTKSAPGIIEKLIATAEGKNPKASEELVMRAQERVIELVHGKSGKTRTGNVLPTTKEERLKMAEDIVLMAADAGDAESARAYLAAHMPEKWGKLIEAPKDPTKKDTLRWVPVLGGTPTKGQTPS